MYLYLLYITAGSRFCLRRKGASRAAAAKSLASKNGEGANQKWKVEDES